MSHPSACAGRHLLIDLHGVAGDLLGDIEHIRAACEDAAVATGATIIGGNFHHFGDGCGVSGVVLLAESHLSIHSWPERGFASLDVFVCGDCDPLRAIPVLKARFAPVYAKVDLHLRGEGWAEEKAA